MEQNVHGHEIFRMLKEANNEMTRDALKAKVEEEYGSEPTFVNCSGQDFQFDELLPFLEGKGKIRVSGDVVTLIKGECD